MSDSLLRALCPFALAVILCCGCQQSESGPPKYHVSGKVSFENEPIGTGTIVFIPTTSGRGAQIGIPITDGIYEGQVTAGPNRIYIEASRPGPQVTNDLGQVHDSLDWYIPPKYNHATKLAYEVLPQVNTEVNFDLE